ncbi:MAG: hypothetical protein JJ892_13160 [Balneola sp.]|nr:hypothetical protein [Balneola sp.]MBO6649611.1 hypothetical protein [Balneola sp.]MBO6711428.1 hypothetical protein [Balneola sp.]MBO6801218.1 hypothetical protein [Balneola sp.]MBO6869364.1 hypothetical protein [Balneola sp.]
MEPFELKTDTSTFYMKALKALGFILLGFTIVITLLTYKNGEPINWMNTFTLTVCSLAFALFPGFATMSEIHFNEEGIFLKNHSYHWGEKKEITWDKISSIRVDKSQLSIKNTVGSSEKIKLPIYTKDQIEGLKSYLKEVASQKEVEYLE